MTKINKDTLSIINIIIIFHILLRILIYFSHLSERSIYFSDEFIEALDNKNFLHYLFFHHSIPIGNIIISKFTLIFAGKDNLYLFYYFLNSMYSLTLIICLSKIYKIIFGKYSYFFYLILIFTSISFLSYDTWRVNHYDHILILLFSIFSLFLTKILISNEKAGFGYKYIMLMTLLMLFSTLFIIIFIILFSFIIFFQKKYNFDIKSFLSASLIIVIFFSLTLIKNKISINDYTPTSIKGWNFIQRPLYTLGYEKYFNLYLKETNISKLNKLCVNEIKKNHNSDDLFLSLVLHKCFFDFDKETYDYDLLRSFLKNNYIINKDLSRAIELDVKDLENKNWKFSGGHKDINLRTTVFFHKESSKLYFSSLINYPYEMFIGTVSTKQNQGIFFTFLNMFRWGSQLPYYYEPQHKNFNNEFIKYLQIIFSIIILICLSVSVVRSYYLITSFLFGKKTKKLDMLIFLLLLICVGYNLTTSFITCCENQRNAVMIFPFLITIVSLTMTIIVENLKKK
jgi:hypothetical protein